MAFTYPIDGHSSRPAGQIETMFTKTSFDGELDALINGMSEMSILPEIIANGLYNPRRLPPPTDCPICCRCGTISVPDQVAASNRLGDAERPCFRCNNDACYWRTGAYQGLLAYADYRGNLPWNPVCSCGVPSKLMLQSNILPDGTREMYYCCRLGMCDYYAVPRDKYGAQVRVAHSETPYYIKRRVF
ncbi:hypothetical protein KEM54_004605 [Ascosphaera aggregata]|nr:hypothetical protein KEM54_004605 [Ascosphaera aggregata]